MLSTHGRYYVYEQGGFRYLTIGKGRSWKLWLGRDFSLYEEELILDWKAEKQMVKGSVIEVEGEKRVKVFVVEFPVAAEIVVTSKGTRILIPSGDKITYDVFIKCGYRGSASLKVIGNCQMFEYDFFESPRGNLGISAGALVVAPVEEKVIVEFHRDGRLYGDAANGLIILEAGKIQTIDDITYEQYQEMLEKL